MPTAISNHRVFDIDLLLTRSLAIVEILCDLDDAQPAPVPDFAENRSADKFFPADSGRVAHGVGVCGRADGLGPARKPL
jgi:hypothetical protein